MFSKNVELFEKMSKNVHVFGKCRTFRKSVFVAFFYIMYRVAEEKDDHFQFKRLERTSHDSGDLLSCLSFLS